MCNCTVLSVNIRQQVFEVTFEGENAGMLHEWCANNGIEMSQMIS